MRSLVIALSVLVTACAQTPIVRPPTAAPTASPVPATATPTVTPAPRPTSSPVRVDGLTTTAMGTLRGEIAWVLRAVTARDTNRTNAEIWAVPIAGGEPRLAVSYRVGLFERFGPMTGIVLDRQLSDDGTKLALELPDYDRPRPGLHVVDVTAGVIREIAGPEAGPSRWITPAWSPDMTRLAFVAVGDMIGGALMTMLSDGGRLTEEVPARVPERTVLYQWIDDARVAYGRSFERGTYEVVTTGSHATTQVPVAAGSWRGPAPPDWRRSTPRFVGAVTEGDGGEAWIVVADDVGAPPRIIVRDPPRSERGLSISPVFGTARWGASGDVLFQRSLVGDASGPFEHECITVAASGGAPMKVPLRGMAFRCEWLPSGDRIAYLHGDTGIGLYATTFRIGARDGSGEREYPLPAAAGASDVRLLDVAIRVYQ